MNTGNPISTQQPATAHRVEFFRLPPPGKRDPFFGLSRGWYYKAAAAGEIKMVAIRNRGAVRGVRLVAYDSVVDYVWRSMNAVKPASRHEPPPQPVAGHLVCSARLMLAHNQPLTRMNPMLSTELSRTALGLPPEDRLELARRLVESVVEPAPLTDAVKEGIRRIEDIATGRVTGLSEDQYRAAMR